MRRPSPLPLALATTLILAQLGPAFSLPQQLRVVGYSWILAPAIIRTESGYAGTTTNVTVMVTEGWGDVYVSTYSLTQEDFQGAATAAARVVCSLLGINFSSYNFYFKVQGAAVIVGGPSAGAAMAVAVYSALTGAPIDRSVMITGMLSPDGTIGPVGGVYEKAQAAARSGARVFLVPPGQSVVVTYVTVERRVGPFRVYSTQPRVVNLTEYAMKEWGLTVREVSTIVDVIRVFFGVEIPQPSPGAITVSDSVLEKVAEVRERALSKAEAELVGASALINSSQLSRLARALLSRRLSEARDYLARAKALRGVEAIQLLTYSISVSRWVSLLVSYYSGDELSRYVSDYLGRLNAFLASLGEKSPRDFQELNYLVIATDLAVRSARLYNESARLWSSDPEAALQNLAYSSAFLEEAEAWLENLGRGPPFPAQQAAQTYISVARSTWSYAYAVISSSGGSTTLAELAGSYYNFAISSYSSGRSLLAAVAAAKSVAIAEAALLSLQSSATGSDVYLRVSREQAMAAVSQARDLLAGIYFLNFSSLVTQQDALAMYKHATHLSTLTLELAKSLGFENPAPEHGGIRENPQPPQPSGRQEKRGEDLVSRILGFLEKVIDAIRGLLKRLADMLIGGRHT